MKQEASMKNKVGASVNDWAIALKEVNEEGVAERLYEEPEIKKKGLQLLEKYNLPRLEIVNLPLDVFLKNSEEFLNKICSDRYYVSLRDLSGTSSRVRAIDLTKKEVFNFIKTEVREEETPIYEILLFNYYANVYSGNIIVSTKNNKVFLELAAGNHGGVVSGEVTPTVFAEASLEGGFARLYEKKAGTCHSITDKELRGAIIKVLAHLSCAGYYEFILTRKEESGPLTPIFIDYRSDEKYQIHDWL